MHKRRVLYFREPEVHSILLRQLSHSGYRIYPKVRLADAINKDQNEHLTSREFDYLSRAHLDFLVIRDELPIFAVEFDGLAHIHDQEAIERDVLKNRLCKAANLPVLRVTTSEITERDKLTLLDYMLMRFVAWHEEIDGILTEIQEYAANLPPASDPEDLAVDLDPSFHFNVRHPFPGAQLVRERLWRHYRIAWDMDPQRRRASPALLCDATLKRAGPLRSDQFHTSEIQATVWKPDAKHDQTLFSEFVEVTIRSWLPLRTVVPDADMNLFALSDLKELEAAVERFKIRVESMWFPDLPGINAWDVSEHYAEYLGFRAIERWAKRELRTNV